MDADSIVVMMACWLVVELDRWFVLGFVVLCVRVLGSCKLPAIFLGGLWLGAALGRVWKLGVLGL